MKLKLTFIFFTLLVIATVTLGLPKASDDAETVTERSPTTGDKTEELDDSDSSLKDLEDEEEKEEEDMEDILKELLESDAALEVTTQPPPGSSGQDTADTTKEDVTTPDTPTSVPEEDDSTDNAGDDVTEQAPSNDEEEDSDDDQEDDEDENDDDDYDEDQDEDENDDDDDDNSDDNSDEDYDENLDYDYDEDQDDDEYDDYDEDEKDYDYDDDEEDYDYEEDNEEETGSSNKGDMLEENLAEVCEKEVNLSDDCNAGEDVMRYFGGNMTVRGLRFPFINMDILSRLMNCPRPEWCLVETYKELEAGVKNFFRGPLCEVSMWECIEVVLMERASCQDKEFKFIVDAVDMMCNMTSPDTPAKMSCATHVLGALHVTYAIFLKNNMTDAHPEDIDACGDARVGMTKTYRCTDNFCRNVPYSKLSITNFRRWSWMMDTAEETEMECDMDDLCGPLQATTPEFESEISTTTTTPNTPTTSFSAPGSGMTQDKGGKSKPFPVNGAEKEGSEHPLSEQQSESELVLVLTSVAVVVTITFLVLGFLLWRRNRRRNLYYYKSVASSPDGYDKQVPSDEAHLLSQSSD